MQSTSGGSSSSDKPHLQSTHRLESTDRAAIAEGQFRNLTLLAQVAVDAMLLNRNLEHLRCAGAVDVAARFRRPPDAMISPANHAMHSGLDCR